MTDGRYSWTGAVGAPALRDLDPEAPRSSLAEVLKSSRPLGGSCAALELLLHAAHEWEDGQARARAALELRELARAQDPKTGGFPGGEGRELERNARLARLMWDGGALLAAPELARAAEKATAFLLKELFDASAGAFRAGLSSRDFFADANAQAALALLRASAFQGDPRIRHSAAGVLVFLQTRLFDPGRGMLRRAGEGGGEGRLSDNAWTALAFTESFLATGRKPERDFADAVMRHLFQDLWDKDRGGFLDRGAKEPPQEENAVALEALWRLHHLKGNASYRKWVDWGLRSAGAGEHPGLARVQDMAARGRLELELVGRPGEPKADALLAALHARYLPRKIVSFVDPDDQDYILAHKLEAPSYPRLFGCLRHRPAASAAEPSEVAAVLAAIERPA